MARALARRLHAHGDPHGHAVLSYPQACHSLGYLLPDLPTGLLPPDIADRAEDKAAARGRVASSRHVYPATRSITVNRH